MSSSPNFLGKMAQCEMAARFAPSGVADLWRSAADCYLLLAELSHSEDEAALEREPQISDSKLKPPLRTAPTWSEDWIG